MAALSTRVDQQSQEQRTAGCEKESPCRRGLDEKLGAEPAYTGRDSHIKAVKDLTKLSHQYVGLFLPAKSTFGHPQPPDKNLTPVPGLNVHHTEWLCF